MKVWVKAALCSGLVFPGAGYLLLKKPKKAIIFISVACVSMGIILYDVIHKSMAVVERLMQQNVSGIGVNIDVNMVQSHLDSVPNVVAPWVLSVAIATLVVVWLWSVIDVVFRH